MTDQKQSSNTHSPGPRCIPRVTARLLQVLLYRAPGLLCFRSHMLVSVNCPICPLHTFTNDSKCHLPPNVPAPDTLASVHALTCPRAHTHTHAHTRVHTHPRPGSAPQADSGAASGVRPPLGGWCRAPRPRRRCQLGLRDPRPQCKLLAAAGVPPKRGGLPGSLYAGKRACPSPRGYHRSPGIQMGTGEEEGEDPLFDFLRRNSSWSARSRVGVGGAPISEAASGLSGRGGSFGPRASRENAGEARAKPRGT